MSNFTPSNQINYSKEKDWPANLGMIDWDDTNIIFTKRSLIEFLKYTGTTVDTNFSNIQKLPKYAVLGKFSEPLPKPGEVSSPEPVSEAPAEPAEPEEEQGIQFQSSVRPSRRVREQPGGTDSISSLWTEDSGEEFKPTRRVRQGPGGHDSISQIF